MAVWKRLCERRGAVAIMIGVAMVVFLALTALAIDIGFGLVTKNELHNVADAAALAGTRKLGKIYEALSVDAQQTYVLNTTDRTAIVTAVQTVAGQNHAAGVAISIDAADIRIGQWNATSRTLTVTNNQPDAVEVTARRDATANGPIATFFATIMGINSLNVTSTSQRVGGAWTGGEQPTAALTGVGQVAPGVLDVPVGISKEWFENKAVFCGQPIRFSPTNSPEGCAGWHTFFNNANANNLRNIIDGLNNGSYTSPGATAGETQFNFTGGQVANAFTNFKNLYDAKKNPVTGEWETFVVVYDRDDCSNPNQAITIVGFAKVTITAVCNPPGNPCPPPPIVPDPVAKGEKRIQGKVECDIVEQNTRGGGANYGVKGSIPGLVK